MGFIEQIPESELLSIYKDEKDAKAKMRLLALIKRKEGMSIKRISEDLKVPKSTVFDWINNVDKEGLERLHDQERPGRPSKLMIEQKSMLKKEIIDSPRKFGMKADVWTVKTFRFHIQKNYGIKYSIPHAYRLVKKLELSLIKPRPRDYRANKEEQERWRKEFKKSLKNTKNKVIE